MAATHQDPPPRQPRHRLRPGRIYWIVGLAVGILVGAAVAVSLAEITEGKSAPALSS